MKKHFYILFILAFTFLFSNNSYAVVNPVIGSTTEIVVESPTFSKKEARKMKRFQRRLKRKAKFSSWLSKLYKDTMDNETVIALLLVFFLGAFGIHRIYLGAKPVIALWYFLASMLFGLGVLLALIDFVRILMGNISDYKDNDSFIAF